ncbi:MAG TPA: class I SAM-dependent methyltransferase [Caldimonas sp.]|nr:class I SAM-dependent methyltransferase [Caldimonas sp.]
METPREPVAGDAATPAKKPFGWKLVRNLRRAFRRPIAGYRVVQDAVRGRAGLEIGGPTKLFRRDLPIYRVVAGLDGVNFAARTVWEGELAEGRTYRYGRRGVGHQYIADATDLARIGDARYDFVLSSNNLEHIANPIKALHEWVRVLKPGGHLLLVLPRKESNFDHRRDVTPFEHLLEDHRRDMTEADLTHLDEIVARHDYAMTPDTPTPDALRARGLANVENRCLHHHVFDPPLIDRLLGHVGLEPVWAASTATDHLALAHKPSR